MDEISPIAHISGLRMPLLLIHDRDDGIYPVSEAILLKKFCERDNLPVRMQIIAGTLEAKHLKTTALIKNFIEANR